MPERDQAKLFVPANRDDRAGERWAMKGPLPRISAKVVLAADQQLEVDVRVIQCARAVTNATARGYCLRKRGLTLLKPTFRGIAKWDYDTDVGIRGDSSPGCALLAKMPDNVGDLKCPNCARGLGGKQVNAQTRDLETKAFCPSCRTKTPLHRWTCECSTVWHACPLHGCGPNGESIWDVNRRGADRGSTSTTCEDTGKRAPKSRGTKRKVRHPDTLLCLGPRGDDAQGRRIFRKGFQGWKAQVAAKRPRATGQ